MMPLYLFHRGCHGDFVRDIDLQNTTSAGAQIIQDFRAVCRRVHRVFPGRQISRGGESDSLEHPVISTGEPVGSDSAVMPGYRDQP
ncbi:hypothetical protein ADK43_37520 [Streptomyces rimosus subsp. rimosus]|nr:hypothetical protein ADK43_37520 [Streptomyces rimosus subsp. rimosus]